MRRGEGGALGGSKRRYTHMHLYRGPHHAWKSQKHRSVPESWAETFFFVSEETYGSKLLGDP